jgi:transcriptional regulator with GAF, ATPase, and Fis domain
MHLPETTAIAISSEAIDLACLVRQRSTERWGEDRRTTIVGRHPIIAQTLARGARFARAESPVLITGETGTGKELFARAIHLLSPRVAGAFLTVNCAQYQEGQLIASELFGHKRGSFTGAVGDHRGIFEAAEGGTVFLDEVGELTAAAQAMLLRLLSEGEIVPVGDTRCRRVDVRVVVATNRDLKEMVRQGRFRADLYYRLRYLQLHVPPVRDRGGDWELILEHYLDRLGAPRKRLSAAARALLGRYGWPGNVREVRSLADTGFHLSDGEVIEPGDFIEALEEQSRADQLEAVPLAAAAVFERLAGQQGSFWELVHGPYLNRDLNRLEVQQVLARGLDRTRGSYKKLVKLFGMEDDDYLKFMDFVRHHNLRPAD